MGFMNRNAKAGVAAAAVALTEAATSPFIAKSALAFELAPAVTMPSGVAALIQIVIVAVFVWRIPNRD